MKCISYLVYSYQYREMSSPKIDASRRVYRDRRDLDSLPPTVIKWVNVAACTKREAIATGKPLLLTRYNLVWSPEGRVIADVQALTPPPCNQANTGTLSTLQRGSLRRGGHTQ